MNLTTGSLLYSAKKAGAQRLFEFRDTADSQFTPIRQRGIGKGQRARQIRVGASGSRT